jgi:hypothetical protein
MESEATSAVRRSRQGAVFVAVKESHVTARLAEETRRREELERRMAEEL